MKNDPGQQLSSVCLGKLLTQVYNPGTGRVSPFLLLKKEPQNILVLKCLLKHFAYLLLYLPTFCIALLFRLYAES